MCVIYTYLESERKERKGGGGERERKKRGDRGDMENVCGVGGEERTKRQRQRMQFTESFQGQKAENSSWYFCTLFFCYCFKFKIQDRTRYLCRSLFILQYASSLHNLSKQIIIIQNKQ